jgi:DNA-binding winged helix-turn-helix (wHTH) protein
VNGLFLVDEIRFVYSWDESKSITYNLSIVKLEDIVLRQLIQQKTIDGVWEENEYRKQEVRARMLNSSSKVWSDWEEVDPAYREYDHVVLLYGYDADKFSKICGEFGLRSSGLTLTKHGASQSDAALPKLTMTVNDDFSIHAGDVLSYRGKIISLQPQTSRIIRLIMERAITEQYTPSQMIVDECLGEDYLDRNANSPDRVYTYVRRCISEARKTFLSMTGKEKDKNFFPNKPGVGYTFTP